jgi:hypothetical protein
LAHRTPVEIKILEKIQSLAICLIAVVLVAMITVKHVRPYVILTMNEEQYFELSERCHEAFSSMKQVRDFREDYDGETFPDLYYDEETFSDLYKASTVAMMDCYGKDVLRLDLLSKGVGKVDLDLIDLRAKESSNASIRYFVRGLGTD